MNKFTFAAEVVSDLYLAGTTEDGQRFTAERYFVSISNEYGQRFRHNVYFNGTTPIVDEEGYSHFPDERESAIARASTLADRINFAIDRGLRLDMTCWYPDDPVYGSDYYIASGEEAKRAFDERNEVEA
jgi:hypothetical protein